MAVAPFPQPASDPFALLDASSAPTLVCDAQGLRFANAALRQLLGREAPAGTPLAGLDWWVGEGGQALQAYLAQAWAGEADTSGVELRLHGADGRARAFEFSARPWAVGRDRVLVLTGRDLQDIHTSQETLLELSQLLHQIMENDPVPAFVLDERGRVSYWNAACERLTGVPSRDMMGATEAWRAFYEAPRPLLADLVMDGRVDRVGLEIYGTGLKRSASDPRAWQFEGYFPNLGGRGRWLQVTAAPLQDEGGRVVGAIETLQDVSDRRIAEDEVRRHRAELEDMVAARTAELLVTHHELDAFMANAPVGIVASRGGRITRANRTFHHMFGLDEGGPGGLGARRFFFSRAEYRDFLRTARAALRDGDSFTHEVHLRCADGSSLWVQCIAYLSDAIDGVPQVWWLLQDRTGVMRAQRQLVGNYRALKEVNQRLAEAQNQLIQSEKMASLGQLAAGLAHEINNPLGFVCSNLVSMRRYALGLIALVRGHEQGAAPQELARLRHAADVDYVLQDLPQLLDQSEEGLARVKKIILDLKDFSRVDQSDWQDADLNAGLDSTLNMAMHELKYKARVVKAYGEIPRVHCLAGQLNQVFMNLVVNAAQAIEQDGEIVVRTGVGAHEGVDGVWVEVQDNGMGMTPEVQRRVFEPFFTTKPVGQGTGLGLSLSFSIIKKHEGHIELDSTPGVGTRFRVWVPVAGPQGAGRPPH